MSLPLTLAATDYITKPFRISTQNATQLNALITVVERRELTNLFGSAVYLRIKDNITLKAQDEALINGYDYIDSNDVQRSYQGYKQALKYTVYFEFVKDNFETSDVGLTRNENTNKTHITPGESAQIVHGRRNAGVTIYNDETLPFIEEFANPSGTILTSVDNADNTYNVTVDGTDSIFTFLQVGDTITINDTDYIVTVANDPINPTQITFDAGSIGLDFTGNDYDFTNFEDFNTNNERYGWL